MTAGQAQGPLWRQLITQDALDKQYEVLYAKNVFSVKEGAMHLARFAEAHIFNAADREIENLLAERATLTAQLAAAEERWRHYSQDAMGIIADACKENATLTARVASLEAELAGAMEECVHFAISYGIGDEDRYKARYAELTGRELNT